MIVKLIWAARALLYKVFFGRIGRYTYIGPPIYLNNVRRIFLGRKVRIYPHVRLEVVNNKSSIIIEDNVSIGQNVHITSGSEMVIKANVTLAENICITNIDHEYEEIGKHILEQPLKILKTEIGENCFIGFGAVIQAGTILGRQCIVGSNSVVRGNFPDFCVIVGVPAKIVKRYDVKLGKWCKTNAKGDFLNG